jgi:SAM-dependent methyltransferase
MSPEQLELAANNAKTASVQNISFHQATVYATTLPRDAFDLVYSRFVMCHLVKPIDALIEMRALLKKGGVLVCEDYDDSSIMTDPPSAAYARLVEISRAVHARRGMDSEIGPKLHRLFRQAGFSRPEVSFKQPAFLRGEGKRFWELTLREAEPAIIETGVATAEEVDSICREMQRIAKDDTTLVIVARVSQIWASKE